MTTLTRTDCKRDNVKVFCRNAILLGFGINYCKRGFWVQYKDDEKVERIGRAIGRVTCEGKVFIELAVASQNWASAYIRWVDPASVIEVRMAPPRRVFNFFADTGGWYPEAIFRALEYGVSDLHDQQHAREASEES